MRQQIFESNLIHPSGRTTGQLEFEETQLGPQSLSGAQGVSNPDITRAVDRHALATVAAGGKHFDLARVARRKARNRATDRVIDPDPVLLVDRNAERGI